MKQIALVLSATCLLPMTASAQSSAGTLMGDDIRVQLFTYQGLSGTATVTPSIEFENYWGPPVFEQNLKAPRWSLDIQANKIIATVAAPGGATYGNGYYVLFDGLDPIIPGCSSGGKVIGGTISSTDPTATFLTANLVIADHSVRVPAGPSGGHTWPGGAQIEVDLDFGCQGLITGNLQTGTVTPNTNPAPAQPTPAIPVKKKKKRSFLDWLRGR